MIIVIHLHRHDSDSVLDGLGTPLQAAKRAAELNQFAISQTNHGNLNGSLKHIKACDEIEIHPICGIESYWRPNRLVREKEWRFKRWHIIFLAKNLKGWHNLIKLSSHAFSSGFYQNPCVDFDLMREYKDGIICSSSCILGPLSFLVQNGSDTEIKQWIRTALDIYSDDLYFSIMPHDFDLQRKVNLEVISYANQFGIPIVYEGDSHYPFEGWEETQKLSILIGMNQTVAEAEQKNKERIAKGEEIYELWHPGLHIMDEKEVRDSFVSNHPDIPLQAVEESIKNTDYIASRIEPFLVDRSIKMPVVKVDAESEVRKWCREGMERIEKVGDPIYEKQLEYELEVIKKRENFNYMCIVGDWIRWCRSDAPLPPTPDDPTPAKKRPMRLSNGRGSAAGSLVCYLSRITTLDPIPYKLKFERFLNPERKGLPDIDIDFPTLEKAGNGRKIAKEYLVRKYGREKVADIMAQQRFTPVAALKSITKTLYGFKSDPDEEISKICHKDSGLIDPTHDSDLEEMKNRIPQLMQWSQKYPVAWMHAVRLENGGDPFIKTISKHAAAVVITPTAVTDHIPTIRAGENEEGFRTAWSETPRLSIVDDFGFVKVDALGLTGMDQQQMIIDLVFERTGEVVDIDNLPVLKDPYAAESKVMKSLSNGLTLGVNQFSNNGITNFIKRAKPDNIVHLAAINALYRPGPMGAQGPFHFADRKNEEEEYEIPDTLIDILDDTYGVIAFQEQVMELFETLAEYTPGQADGIRKIIAKLYRERGGKAKEALDKHKKEFVEKASEHVGLEKAEVLFSEIEPYCDYCISGDTELIRAGSGRYDKSPNITAEQLYYNWHSKESIGKKLRWKGAKLLAMDSDGRIRPAIAKNIWFSGFRETYKVILQSGKFIKATDNHRLLTNDGYKEIKELTVDDYLITMGEKELQKYVARGLVNRGIGKSYEGEGTPNGEDNPGWIDGRHSYLNETKKIVSDRSRGICENCGQIGEEEKHDLEFAHLKFLDEFNGDIKRYNSPENIKHFCNSCHKKYDYRKGDRKRRWTKGRPTELDKIISIEKYDIEPTFDIEMDSYEHNFIANEIVSHNSFNRGHASGYSLQSYQDAWLKFYYPMDTYSVIMSLEPKESLRAIREARDFGISILPPDVNISGSDYTPDFDNNALRYGLIGIKGVGETAADWIIEHRPFVSYEDFEKRTNAKYSKCNKKVREALLKVGALDSLGGRAGWSNKEKAEAEMQLLGMALSPGGTLGDYEELVIEKTHSEAEYDELEVGEDAIIGGQITEVKKIKTKNGRNPGQEMAFAKIGLGFDNFNLTIFPGQYQQYKEMLYNGSAVMVRGRKDSRGIIVNMMMNVEEFAQEMEQSDG